MLVSYPDLSNISNGSGIGEIAKLPNASYPFFWATILAGFWVIITSLLYYEDKRINGKGNLMAAMAVSAFACIFLAVLGSLVGIFTATTLVPTLVVGVLIIVIWILT